MSCWRSPSPGSCPGGTRRSSPTCTWAPWCSWSPARSRGAGGSPRSTCTTSSSAAIAVFATPVAVAAVWLLLAHLRATRHPRLAVGVIVLCAIQLELGVVVGLARIQGGAADPTEPVPVSLLRVIEQLPADAKLAYACRPFEEVSFVNSKLLSIDAHTGRRVVPMCFQADTIGPFYGAEPSSQVPDAGFAFAPQAALYPDCDGPPVLGRRRGLPEGPRHRLHLRRCEASQHPGGRRGPDRDERRSARFCRVP